MNSNKQKSETARHHAWLLAAGVTLFTAPATMADEQEDGLENLAHRSYQYMAMYNVISDLGRTMTGWQAVCH